jgi:hypothetical protein
MSHDAKSEDAASMLKYIFFIIDVEKLI